ncbi:hypothetical protein F5882DRAFT_387501 [Hyaloscypha sp. PMI_1271]|nr:hypothetical protein F5882DRAFT_387501 [Hyaloscypha sp. PMI_1271]
MPNQDHPNMAVAHPTPSQTPAHQSNHASGRVHCRVDNDDAQNRPSIQVTPASQSGRNNSAGQGPDAGYLVPPSRQGHHGLLIKECTTTPRPSKTNNQQSVRSRKDDSEPSHGTYSSNRHSREPNSQTPNLSGLVRNQQGGYNGSSEPPIRTTSLLPPDEAPSPSSRTRMSATEADALCKELTARIWHGNMSKMYDKVVEADKRGNVDDRLYQQLLDFFYCFLPMVTKAPPADPIVVRQSDLENHRKILNLFGDGRSIRRQAGRNDPHRWFSKPSDGSFKSRMEEGIRGLHAALRGKKGRGEHIAHKP